MDQKKWWQSKTLWVQLLVTLTVLFGTLGKPEIGEWIKAHLIEGTMFWAFVNAVLRKFTDTEIG